MIWGYLVRKIFNELPFFYIKYCNMYNINISGTFHNTFNSIYHKFYNSKRIKIVDQIADKIWIFFF